MKARSATGARTALAVLAAASLVACGPAERDIPAPGAEDILVGSVVYRERIALPADAIVTVRLEDVSIADAPAAVLAEQTIAADGRQVPIPFELRYPRDRIAANRRYGVRAEIRAAGGELMFTTPSHHGVLAGGAPPERDVEIVVERVRAGAGATTGSITGEPWRLVALRRPGAAEAAVPSEQTYTIEFGADGRYSGQAHCNRYLGSYERPAPGELRMRGGAATLAACPAPSLADEYLRAVAAVSRHAVQSDELRLTYGTGGELVFVRERAGVAAPEVGRTFVYDCAGGVSFTVRTGPGELALWAPESLGGAYTVLAASPAESTERYEESGTVAVIGGESAAFEIGGQRYADCISNPTKVPWADAKRRGATFRALGNEPAWNLEIFPDRLVMVTNLGADRAELVHGGPAVDGARTTYHAAGERELTAVLERRTCTDAMSGEAFEAAATVTFGGETFRGCGRFL